MVVNRLKTRRDQDILQHQKPKRIERVSEMIQSNRRLTIREISEDLNISYGSVQNILTIDVAPCDFWLFPKVRMTTKGTRFNRFRTSRQTTSRTASESGKNNGISVFEAKGSILSGTNGNVSFPVIKYFYLNIHHIFLSEWYPR
jgi:hypothetical protein